MTSKIRTKAKYRFIEFVRPDGFWPAPYSIEQAFGVLGWMIETELPHRDETRWGWQDIRSLLSCKPTCVNFSEIDPITSTKDLQRRFHHALLSGFCGRELRRWRKKFKVTPDGERTIAFPHYQYGGAGCCEAELERGIDALLQANGQLSVQLNECHADAIEILGCRLHYSTFSHGWRFVLVYGVDGSEWRHELSQQRKGETFAQAFFRAKHAIGELTKAKAGAA